jgi:hypothetical protein
VLAALILALAALSSATANDYRLTLIGVEPAGEQLLAMFQKQTGLDLDQPVF